jgi:arsenate reductase
MAEGLLRSLGGGDVDVRSAGTNPTIVRPEAISVMAERGIDISAHRSKHVEEFIGERFDYVITVCDNANESCPVFPGGPTRIHWSVPDPALVQGTEDERLEAFRRACDFLGNKLEAFVQDNQPRKER